MSLQAASFAEKSPLGAQFYADHALQQVATVVENVQLARDTYRVRIECAEIAHRILPGQFVMIRTAATSDPLLGRPLALYDTVLDENGDPTGLEIVYLVVGKMTRLLADCTAGDKLEVWGPLGNGFEPCKTGHLIMVAGGIGQTPFLALGRQHKGDRHYGTSPSDGTPTGRATLCYGARSAEYLAGVNEFHEVGIEVQLATDDGTAGHHGLVTDLLQNVLNENSNEKVNVVCCGPEPMMEAVANLCMAANVPCQVSLETPMACGIGICFSCVTKVKQPDGGWDYKRTCVDGPVFGADKIEWQ